jgi:hypothetical protein
MHLLRILIIALVVLISNRPGCHGQGDTARGEYAIDIYAGGGISLYAADASRPAYLNTEINTAGFAGTFRVMWKPDHLLSVGIESGFANFYSYRFGSNLTDGRVHLTAIPLLLIWSMPVKKNVSVSVGYGSYLLNSTLEYEGVVKTKMFSLGWVASASYLYPVSSRSGMIMELKWMNATETRDAVITAQLQFAWRMFKW